LIDKVGGDMEHRKHERINISIEALILLPHEITMEMATINISDGGVYFDTKTPVPLGTEILMSFSNARSIKDWVKPQELDKIKGTVCRSDDLGLAVSFENKQEFSRYLVIENNKKFRVLTPF
jgi:hypothetical protein